MGGGVQADLGWRRVRVARRGILRQDGRDEGAGRTFAFGAGNVYRP